MNDNERALLRYVVEGDIRKSQQQAKIVLEGLTIDTKPRPTIYNLTKFRQAPTG